MSQTYSQHLSRYKKSFTRPYPYKWQNKSLEEILSLKLQQLKLSITKTHVLNKAIYQVLKEWESLGYRWKPYFWFSTEWFYPEGTYGVAIPFYLAHPNLIALEKYLIGNVEGKNLEDIKKYLRHELGHLLDYSYRWRFNQERRSLFGLSSIQYPSIYHVKPDSKKFVKNLPAHYAQSHPDEDFAETFATYMRYSKSWKRRYPSGLVHRKLALIDNLIKSSKKAKPRHLEKIKPGDINHYKITLEKFYLRRSFERGYSQREISNKMYGIATSSSTRELRQYIAKVLEGVDMPGVYKKYLVHQYYSPLIQHKKVLSLWKNKKLRELRQFIREKPIAWLKKGPFYYT